LIDYDYYLDVDSTQQDYEEYLRWEFYNSSTSALVIPLLNRECQKTYKKVICANVRALLFHVPLPHFFTG
jgi:hypothetical protein